MQTHGIARVSYILRPSPFSTVPLSGEGEKPSKAARDRLLKIIRQITSVTDLLDVTDVRTQSSEKMTV